MIRLDVTQGSGMMPVIVFDPIEYYNIIINYCSQFQRQRWERRGRRNNEMRVGRTLNQADFICSR